ncbi:hypothetical protein GE061_019297 [Apolygus lucorum]|uniref:APCDD1 domain-containing protein n=1 Tax=Apolygus lucorum TaxID=248454 RepID=A0A8S9X7Q3_APOLU|nr:hypothetical protein GE061_019297 [Apolygus lucorum]
MDDLFDLDSLQLLLVCEVKPGPEYMLRWHYYSENGTFSHNTFVYLDDGCSKPVWSRCVKGRYGLRGQSWLMAGASQADFTLQEVMVIVHSGTMAQDLSSRANTSCPGVVVGQWMPEVEYIVYKHQEKNESAPPSREEVDKERSCMALLKLSYEDVGLLRIQRRPPLSYDSWGEREELLLGETKAKVTVFNDPLIRANQEVPTKLEESRRPEVLERAAGLELATMTEHSVSLGRTVKRSLD